LSYSNKKNYIVVNTEFNMENQVLSSDKQLSEEEIKQRVSEMRELYLEVSKNPETKEEIKKLRETI